MIQRVCCQSKRRHAPLLSYRSVRTSVFGCLAYLRRFHNNHMTLWYPAFGETPKTLRIFADLTHTGEEAIILTLGIPFTLSCKILLADGSHKCFISTDFWNSLGLGLAADQDNRRGAWSLHHVIRQGTQSTAGNASYYLGCFACLSICPWSECPSDPIFVNAFQAILWLNGVLIRRLTYDSLTTSLWWWHEWTKPFWREKPGNLALKEENCQILLIKDYLMECSVSTSGSFDWLRGLHG